MSTVASRRRGWCPGALRPMATGDGLLVRVRIPAGRLTPALADALAQAARAFGNGLLDLSARANLQLRGVSEATLAPLQERLATLGLLDADPAAETVRNVLASPFSDIDPAAAMDVILLAHALEARLAGDARLHALPAKTAFVVDAAGTLDLAGVPGDIRLVALGSDRFRLEARGAALGTVAAPDAAEAAAALALLLLAARREDEAHLRDTIARCSPHALAASLSSQSLRFEPRVAPVAAIHPERRKFAGYIPFRSAPGRGLFAAGAPFGRLTADQLARLAVLAESHSAALALTPWRAIALAPLDARAADALASDLSGSGLIADAADLRLGVAACPGAPACASGQAPAQADAPAFAAALGPLAPGTVLHVSGCAKGCAHPGPAAIAIVGDGGRYRLAYDARADASGASAPMTAAALAAYLAMRKRPRPDQRR